jgi:hypothetical protein
MTAKKSKSQIDKFKEATPALGTDDSEKRFNEKLGEIARRKPAKARSKRKR